MRIQHNIMAMNAYRNYNTNTSAVAKNLEKLSSGYKINRAGDDAAGLAISEKMRAQITGLNTASKNVKDGISLVKTAEGAMQEVQDMLNRMVDLATQSANGTYQDAVDREAIQAEIDQLNSEINRIADSANFNGIKLLDGSLDKSAVTGVTYNKVSNEDILGLLPDDMTGIKQGDVDEIGEKGALETDGGTEPSKNSFQISLDGVSVDLTNSGDQEFTLKIGDDTELKATLKGGQKYSGAQLASALANAVKADGVDFGGVNFTVKTDGNVLKFSNDSQTAAELTDKAAVTWTLGDAAAEDPAEEPVKVTDPDSKVAAFNDGGGTAPDTITFDLDGFDVDKAGSVLFGMGGKTYEISFTEDEIANKATKPMAEVLAEKLVDAMNADKLSDGSAGDFTASNTGSAITLTAGSNTQSTDTGITGINAFTVAAKPVENADGADGNMLVTMEEGGEATGATSGKLTAGVTISGGAASDAAAGDKIVFSGTGFKATFVAAVADGKTTWSLDDSAGDNNVPDGFAASFDGTNLAITSNTAGASVESIKNDIGTITASVTAAGSSAGLDGATVTVADTVWTAGTDAVEGPGDGEEPKTETVASGELKATGVDFADEQSALDATKIAAITGLGEVTVGDLKIDLSKISLTANTDTGKTAADAILAAAKEAADAWNKANPESEYTYGNIRISTTPDGANPGDIIAQAAGDGIYILADKIYAEEKGGDGSAVENGYINTGIQNVTTYDPGSKAQLANAAVDFSKVGAWQDGAKITIGDTTYTVAVGADSKFKDVKNVIDLTDFESVTTAEEKQTAAKRLTAAAAGNSIFTVGHDGKGNTTLQQKSAVKDTTDMTTEEKFASYLGVSTPDSIDGATAGKGLTLQIGDTSESFNQLTVSIGDIHADALGVGSINVGTQEGAQSAINVIKNAINQVSSIRGTLGATQNRLEHTQNNLSVMAENIQDAESSIRDTDIAEEMMAYTKNNILVQSAQAMLAQANQVPQGVLQLLG